MTMSVGLEDVSRLMGSLLFSTELCVSALFSFVTVDMAMPISSTGDGRIRN